MSPAVNQRRARPVGGPPRRVPRSRRAARLTRLALATCAAVVVLAAALAVAGLVSGARHNQSVDPPAARGVSTVAR